MRVMTELAEPGYPISRDETVSEFPTFKERVTYRVTVRDLEVAWRIGVYDHEMGVVQPIRIDFELDVRPLENWEADDYGAVPCYDQLSQRIRAMAGDGHVKLVETLAHRIADMCLEDERVLGATVRVEKPEALPGATRVGVEISRTRAV
jgi:dihydroneopterin aldolase